MIQWEAVVALARELDAEHAKGVHNATKAQRLVRAVLTFQGQLATGVRESRPQMTAAPAVDLEAPNDPDDIA